MTATDRTHSAECWRWGPAHYECAVAEIERLRTAAQAAIDALGDLLRCPCCDGVTACADDCTFAADCPNEANTLAVLRDAVRG